MVQFNSYREYKTGLPFLWHASNVMTPTALGHLGSKMLYSCYSGKWVNYDQVVQAVVNQDPDSTKTAKFVEKTSNLQNKEKSHVTFHLSKTKTLFKMGKHSTTYLANTSKRIARLAKRLVFDCFSKKSSDIELTDFSRKI